MEEPSARTELIYRSRSGKKKVVCGGVNSVIIHQDMAIFTGMDMTIRTFEPPGPAVDITAPLTVETEKRYGWHSPVMHDTVVVAKLIRRPDGLQMWVAGPMGTGTTNMIVSWEEIERMSQEGKAEKLREGRAQSP
jgi:hypothetical protein